MRNFILALLFVLVLPVISQAAVLAWTDNSTNEDGFIIYHANCLDCPFTEIARVGPNIVTYTDASSTKDSCYRVTAFNSHGESQPTNNGCMPRVKPNPPGNTTVKP